MIKTVTYFFSCENVTNQVDCEAILSSAKRQGVVTNYDDGRDQVPWFEAMPGPAARKLRDSFLASGYILDMRFTSEE